MIPLLAMVIAYLLGAIPFGYLLVKLKTGADVRSAGSGNIGATNVLRTTGRAVGIATLLLDIAKGYLAGWIAGWRQHRRPQRTPDHRPGGRHRHAAAGHRQGLPGGLDRSAPDGTRPP